MWGLQSAQVPVGWTASDSWQAAAAQTPEPPQWCEPRSAAAPLCAGNQTLKHMEQHNTERNTWRSHPHVQVKAGAPADVIRCPSWDRELTCEQEEDGVVPVVGSLNPLHTQVTVSVLGWDHRQTPPYRPHAVVRQEILFDEAQGVIWGIVETALWPRGRQEVKQTLHPNWIHCIKKKPEWLALKKIFILIRVFWPVLVDPAL